MNEHERNGKTITKHEHCCMKYANRKPNNQMARSVVQRHAKKQKLFQIHSQCLTTKSHNQN